MTQQAKIISRIIKADYAEVSVLLLEIEIDCPECGQQRLIIAGHHLKLVRDLCIQAIDAYPDLTVGGPVKRVDAPLTFGGTPPPDPSKN